MDTKLTSSEHRYERVRAHTAPVVNRRIDRTTRGTIEEVLGEGRDAIVRRLGELDREWDVDRALMVNFALAGAITSAIGFTRYVRTPLWRPRRKGFLGLFAAQLGFLMMHAVSGWCPPASLFRRLGFRTQQEIQAERAVLLGALQGTLA